MSTINVSADVSNFVAGVKQVVELEAQQIKMLKETAQVVIRYDDTVHKFVQTLKGQISATEALTASYRRNKEGNDELIVSVKQISDAAVKAKEAQKQLADGAKAINNILKQNAKDLAAEEKKTAQERAAAAKALEATIKATEKAQADAVKAAEKAKREAFAETNRQRRIDEAEIRRANARGLAEARERGRQMVRAERDAAIENARGFTNFRDDRRSFQSANAGSITSRIDRFTGGEQQRLGGLGVSLDTGVVTKLSSITAKIGELGAKAGLTAGQVQNLFQRVAEGDFKGIEGKYQGLIAQIQRYQATMQSERNRLGAEAMKSGIPGKGPDFPVPNGGHIAKLTEYYTWMNRITGTFTNLAIYRSFNAMTHALTDSVSHARELQINISLIRTLSQEAQLTTTQWAKGLKEVSNATGTDVNKLAKAGYDAVSNQVVKGQGTFTFLKSAAELARVTGSEVGQAGNALSAVINTYKMDARDADEISAKLFRTIDLGRINMGELAQGIGRVNNVAATLGVEFDEVQASLATLTRNGLSTSEAMTLMNSVMSKLTNPTDRMKALLRELGYESGRSAVAIERGFTPVFARISAAIKKQNLEPTDFFNEARSDRGFAALQAHFGEVMSDLDKIKNKSKDTFDAAKGIRSESDADKLTKGLETLKNALSSSFGDVLTRLISQFVDLLASTEEIEKSASRLFRVMATGGLTVGAFILTLRAFAIASEISAIASAKATLAENANQAAKIRGIGVTTAAATAENALAAAKIRSGGGSLAGFAGANPAALFATLAVTGVAAYAAYKATAVDAFDKVGSSYRQLMQQLASETANKPLEKQVEGITKVRTEFDDLAKIVGGKLQTAYSDNEKSLKNIRDRIKESNNALKSGFVGALDLSKNKLKEMENELGKINDRLRDRGKRGDMFAEAARQATTGTMSKYATPGQNLSIVNSEINRVQQKIQELISKGTVESLSEADTLYEKLIQLTTNFYEQDAEIQKKAFEDNLAMRAAQGEKIEGTQTFVYDPIRQQRTMNQLLAARNEAERIGNELLEDQRKKKEVAVAKEKERLALLEKNITDFENFSIYNDSGTIKEKYSTPTGKTDAGKVKADFDAITKGLKSSLGADITGRLELDKAIKTREELFKQEVERTVSQDKVGSAQKNFKDNADQVKGSLDAGKKSLIEYDNAVKTLAQSLGTLNAELGGSTAGIGLKFENQAIDDRRLNGRQQPGPIRALTKLMRGIGQEARPDSQANLIQAGFDKINKESESINKEITSILNGERNKSVNGTIVTDPEAIKSVRDRVKALRTEFSNSLKDAAGLYGRDIGAEDFPLQGGGNLGEFGKGLEQLETKLTDALGKFDTGKSQLEAVQPKLSALNATLEASVKSYDSLGKGVSGVIGGIGLSADAATGRIDSLIQKIEAASARIAELNQGFVGPPAPGVQGFAGEGTPRHQAFGGPIYRNYGGPIGNDRQMAWLQEGEYVMSQAATRRFYSTIVSQNNAGRVPQYFNSGGPVTNMGGVNINVNESRNPGGTSKDIFRAISRAKRLGMH